MNGAAADLRFALTAIYSRNETTAKIFLEKHGVADVLIFTDFAAFAASDSFDAAYVSSPNLLHCRQSVDLMRCGKHVLCEKPMATNLAEVARMVRTAHENKVVLMEAVKTTLLPNFIAIRDALPRIGRIRRYFAQYCQYSSRYDKLKEGVVMNAFDPEMAGGALLDLGVYCLYPMVVLFGKPQSVISTGLLLHTGVDGQGSIIARYDGFDGVCIYSKIADSTLPSEIQGEMGSIVIERINTFERITLHLRDGRVEDISQQTISENMYYELSHFISCVEQGRESETNSMQNSLIVTELMDRVRATIGVRYPGDS